MLPHHTVLLEGQLLCRFPKISMFKRNDPHEAFKTFQNHARPTARQTVVPGQVTHAHGPHATHPEIAALRVQLRLLTSTDFDGKKHN